MTLSTLENKKVTKKDVPTPSFDLSCDVLVIGAGSAGVYAADSAARMGAKVVLLEIGKNIGGMHVCGNVAGYYFGMGGGTFEEDDQKTFDDSVFFINVEQWEQRQIRLNERLEKSNVSILCSCSATGLYFDQNRMVGVRAFDGEKEFDISAKITIDATSDGHIIRMTDAEKTFGKGNKGEYVPFTTRMQYTKDGKFFSCNTDSGIVDHYNKEDFSKSVIFSHANAAHLVKDTEFLSVAIQTGIREGLTFEGEEKLTYRDVLFCNYPEKILFWAYSDFDRHGSERASEEELFQNWWVISNLSTVVVTIPVPLGSVVPKGLKGLVTAGRCFSCDTYTQSAVRMNRDMFRMGECVGIAAALSSLDDVDFLDIDYKKFCSLTKGCREGRVPKGFYFDNTYAAYTAKMNALKRPLDPKYSHLSSKDSIREAIDFDFEKNIGLLNTDSPGPAIWSSYISGRNPKTAEKLFSIKTSAKDFILRANAALALGLLGDARATETLCEIIKRRDCFFFTDNRRSNQFRSAAAICLLGRLGKKEHLDMLFEILKDSEIKKPMYHTLEANYLYHPLPDRNFVYFALATHALMAIYKIYKREGLSLNDLHQKFASLFEGENFLRRITDAKSGEPAYEEIKNFTENLLKLTDETAVF